MKIQLIRWDRFSIPLVSVFGTARGATPTREGLIVRLTTDEGIVGTGEISPLPAFSGATVDDALEILSHLVPSLIGRSVDDLWNDSFQVGEGNAAANAAVRCGLDVAAGDALARRRGLSLARFLAESITSVIPVNATIALTDLESAAAAARDAVKSGFECVKVKVGLVTSVGDEVRRVEAIREAIGNSCLLRLDANGAWSVGRAIASIRALERFNLDLVEQPVGAADLAGLATVRRAVGVRIGADEAVTGIAAAEKILDRDAADVLIVKPMAVGGLRVGRDIIRLASERGRAIVVTTTIDSGVGIAAAVHLAATLRQPIEACGIATGSLLVDDLLVQSLPVQRGTMAVPSGPGLGVEVDERLLRRYHPLTPSSAQVGAPL